MSGRAKRRLLSQHRVVATHLQGRYDDLWRALAEAVAPTGAHAWRFVSSIDPLLHLEFLEFEAANDPRDRPAAREVLTSLDEEIAPAKLEEWLEAR